MFNSEVQQIETVCQAKLYYPIHRRQGEWTLRSNLAPFAIGAKFWRFREGLPELMLSLPESSSDRIRKGEGEGGFQTNTMIGFWHHFSTDPATSQGVCFPNRLESFQRPSILNSVLSSRTEPQKCQWHSVIFLIFCLCLEA